MSLEKLNRKPAKRSTEDEKIHKVKRSKVTKDTEEESDDSPKVTTNDQGQVKLNRSDSRREQKKLLQKRRLERPNAALVDKLKPYWEVIRQKNMDAQKRQKAINDAMALINGNEKELAKKSDSSRILQVIIQYGSVEDRVALTKALCGHSSIANDVYAQHVLKKLVKECSQSREVFVKLLKGSVEHFLTKRIACGVLDDLYRQVNATTKNRIIYEIYSKEFVKFEPKEGSANNNSTLGLVEILENQPAKKEVILGNLRTLMPKLLNKELLMYQIVQRLILDYLMTEAPSKLNDSNVIAPFLNDGHIEALISTSMGSLVVGRLIAVCGSKERKSIVKTLKAHFPVMVKSPHQYNVILSILSFVDDTVLVGKALVPEIISAFYSNLNDTKITSRLVLFLLAGRISKYITPQSFAFLASCDQAAKLSSKKDTATRHAELLSYAQPLLFNSLKEQLMEIAKNEDSNMVLVELFHLEPQSEIFVDLLSKIHAESGFLIVEDKVIDRLLRNFIKKSEILASRLFEIIKGFGFEGFLGNDACFLFIIMLRYQSLFSSLESLIPQVEAVNSEAAKILLAKLKAGYQQLKIEASN